MNATEENDNELSAGQGGQFAGNNAHLYQPNDVQPYQSRSEAFGQGVLGSPGLAEHAASMAASLPRRFVPDGMSMQYHPSGTGMSASDQQRMMPYGNGMLSTNNGQGKAAYSTLWFKNISDEQD